LACSAEFLHSEQRVQIPLPTDSLELDLMSAVLAFVRGTTGKGFKSGPTSAF
jgi:hypothetical protein